MTELESSIRHQSRIGLSLLVGLFVYVTTLAAAHRVLNDPDPYLHIAVGRWIIAHGEVPHHDLFSNSVPNAPWVPHEWLAEVATAWLYDHLGWAGLVIATAVCFAATIVILIRFLLRYLEPSQVLITAVFTWGFCYIHLLARPHVFSWPLLVLWVAALVAARSENRAPPIVVALIMVPWANLHGSFVFGLGLAAIFAAEALLQASSRRALLGAAYSWGLFLGVSVLAGLVTPNGVSGLVFPLQFTRMDSVLSMVQEWKSPNFQYPQPLEYWLMLVLIGALSIGLRLSITRIAVLLLLLHMALGHRRNVEYLGLIAPLIVAPDLASQLRNYRLPRLDRRLDALTGFANRTGIALAAALAVILISGFGIVRIGIANELGRFIPAKAVAFAQEQHIAGPVFNDYAFGDYLIYRGIAPFVDGRADMYGDTFIKRYRQIEKLPSLLTQYGITWTLLDPDDPRVTLLDYLPGWRRAYADEIAVVHVRREDAAVAPSNRGG